jgi:hypothetical protein
MEAVDRHLLTKFNAKRLVIIFWYVKLFSIFNKATADCRQIGFQNLLLLTLFVHGGCAWAFSGKISCSFISYFRISRRFWIVKVAICSHLVFLNLVFQLHSHTDVIIGHSLTKFCYYRLTSSKVKNSFLFWRRRPPSWISQCLILSFLLLEPGAMKFTWKFQFDYLASS